MTNLLIFGHFPQKEISTFLVMIVVLDDILGLEILNHFDLLLSDPFSSHNTSENPDADDSISEVIDVLRGTTLSDGRSTGGPRDYEDSDE